MDSKKKFKCPICGRIYIDKAALYGHMEGEHEDQLDGMPAAQFYFNMKYNKTGGKCVECGKPTEFNLTAERYERFDKDSCRKQYRERFVQRMKNAFGKEHLLDDPDQQKKMLANRSISGTYKWSDGKHETVYTGSYEKDFLEFMDHVMRWSNPADVMMPAPQIFKYKGKDGKEHFYVPDVYIGSLNLIIEIKSQDNKHYRERDIEIERTKDDILGNSGYAYLKLYDKDYSPFFEYLMKLKGQ